MNALNESLDQHNRLASSLAPDQGISDGSVNLLEIQIQRRDDSRKQERVKDAALTRGGIIIITEKGECYIALAQTAINEKDEIEDLLGKMFEEPSPNL